MTIVIIFLQNMMKKLTIPLPGDRIFFSLAGFWFVILTLVGFSPTFYFRIFPDPLPFHQIVHGILFSAWVLLFFVQTILVYRKKIRWHMNLGAISVILLILMIPVGFHVVLVKAANGLKTVDEAGFNLTELALGFTLAFIAIANRKRSFYHKRLMLFPTLFLTIAAADRVAIVLGLEEIRLFRKLLAVVPAIALVFYDAISFRRIPVLGLSLLTLVWAVIWYYISDLLFMKPAGEALIAGLIKIFVW